MNFLNSIMGTSKLKFQMPLNQVTKGETFYGGDMLDQLECHTRVYKSILEVASLTHKYF